MAEEKLDIHDLLKQWERLGPLVVASAAEPSLALQQEVSGFVFRLASSLPEVAGFYLRHDDMCRSILFLAEQGIDINIRGKDGQGIGSAVEDLAKAYITMARIHGWKPPRECD